MGYCKLGQISDLIPRQRKTAAANGQRHSIRRHRNMPDRYENFRRENFAAVQEGVHKIRFPTFRVRVRYVSNTSCSLAATIWNISFLSKAYGLAQFSRRFSFLAQFTFTTTSFITSCFLTALLRTAEIIQSTRRKTKNLVQLN